MPRWLTATLVAMLGLGALTPAALAQPRDFAAYPAPMMRGPGRMPDMGFAPRYRQFGTAIRRGARGGANFAGHYALVMVGCGGGCRLVMLVDLANGRISDFPLSGEDYYQLDLVYRRNSRLVHAAWQTQDASPACVHQDLVLNGAQLQRMPEQRTPGECPLPR